MKKLFFIIIIIATSLACSQKPNSHSLVSKKTFFLRILHVNDTHSHLQPSKLKIFLGGKKYYIKAGGYARIAKYVEQAKKTSSHVLFLHAGDALQGTLYYIMFHGKADIAALNQMHIDAMCLGNHEFDKGAKALFKNFVSRARFPIVCANIKIKKGTPLYHRIFPFIIKKIDHQKIGIVGLITPSTAIISSPGPGIFFENYISVAKKMVKILKSKGVNKIIFLTHIGFKNDIRLAQEVEDIDIIVGGHSHTLLGNWQGVGLSSAAPYPYVVFNHHKPVLIVSAWKWGRIIGDLRVRFNEQGVIINPQGSNSHPLMLISPFIQTKNNKGQTIPVPFTDKKNLIKKLISHNVIPFNQSRKLEKLISSYSKKLLREKKRVIGRATQDLLHVRLPGEAIEGQILSRGSLLAPLVARAFLEKAKEVGGADIALENAGAVRRSIFQGNISVADIYETLPFGNTLTLMVIRGSLLKKAISEAVKRSWIERRHSGAFPYLAGARVVLKTTLHGRKLLRIEVEKNKTWQPLDANRFYRVITNSYVAGGGDYYMEFKRIGHKENLGFRESDVFLEYIKKHHCITPVSPSLSPVEIVKEDQ